MLWQFKQTLAHKILAQLYQIQPQLLSKHNQQAWTNLGLWQQGQQDYVQAAQQLAQYMADAVALKSADRVLDIGCGYGASLALWHEQYQVQQVSAMDLQPICCQKIFQQKQQHHLHYIEHIFQQSIFDAKPTTHLQLYDVIISVDATYHYVLQNYLNAIEPWLAPSGRIACHVLIKSPSWQHASVAQQQQLHRKLRWAKVASSTILDEAQLLQCLAQQGYHQIQIEDLTQQVLQGFADYIAQQTWSAKDKLTLGFAKIYLTSRLCHALAQSHLLQYVQVTAQKC